MIQIRVQGPVRLRWNGRILGDVQPRTHHSPTEQRRVVDVKHRTPVGVTGRQAVADHQSAVVAPVTIGLVRVGIGHPECPRWIDVHRVHPGPVPQPRLADRHRQYPARTHALQLVTPTRRRRPAPGVGCRVPHLYGRHDRLDRTLPIPELHHTGPGHLGGEPARVEPEPPGRPACGRCALKQNGLLHRVRRELIDQVHVGQRVGVRRPRTPGGRRARRGLLQRERRLRLPDPHRDQRRIVGPAGQRRAQWMPSRLIAARRGVRLKIGLHHMPLPSGILDVQRHGRLP